jgi:hypothetical protein
MRSIYKGRTIWKNQLQTTKSKKMQGSEICSSADFFERRSVGETAAAGSKVRVREVGENEEAGRRERKN